MAAWTIALVGAVLGAAATGLPVSVTLARGGNLSWGLTALFVPLWAAVLLGVRRTDPRIAGGQGGVVAVSSSKALM